MSPGCIYFIIIYVFALLLLNVTGKHNILLIISDDLRPTLGCYGDTVAYTPNVDELSQESAAFLSTYAQVTKDK